MRILLLLPAIVLFACASVATNDKQALVGQWRYADATQSCSYLFSSDGNFRAEVAIRGETVARFTGRWSVDGDALLYEYLTDQRGEVAPGTRDRDKLLRVGKNSFVIRAADGSERRYERTGR